MANNPNAWFNPNNNNGGLRKTYPWFNPNDFNGGLQNPADNPNAWTKYLNIVPESQPKIPATTSAPPPPQNPNNTPQEIKSLLPNLNEEQRKNINRVLKNFNDQFNGAMNSNAWRRIAKNDGGLPKTRPIIQSVKIAPSNQDILNQYNAWLRAGNPGNTFEWRLADGTTITEQNVNNILNPYGFGKPEGVPSYIPEEIQQHDITKAMNPNWTEAQIQRQQNSLNPNNRIPKWW